MKTKKVKRWKPRYGERCWKIDVNSLGAGIWESRFRPEYCLYKAALFPTKREATAALKRVKAALRVEG